MSAKRGPDSISVSDFKATCLAVLERVRRTGRPILVTKRGAPLAQVIPPSADAFDTPWLGAMRGTARLADDLVDPVGAEWEALGG